MTQKDTDPKTSLIEAIYKRRSVRGYLNKKIPEHILQRIFQIAQQAPSNCNIQPWRVMVATGRTRDRISKAMTDKVNAGIEPNQDYEYRGDFSGDYRKRQVDCAVALYNTMGIERTDKQGRKRALLRNYEFFDAPYMAFLGMAAHFGTTVALDVGMYAQNLMLTLTAFGLHSCAMGSMRNYPDIVRKEFDLTPETKILCGIAFGYEDPAVPANRTRIDRAPVESNLVIRT